MKVDNELSYHRIGLSNNIIYSEKNKAGSSNKKISASKTSHPNTTLHKLISKIKIFANAVILRPIRYCASRLKKMFGNKKNANDQRISNTQNIFQKRQETPKQLLPYRSQPLLDPLVTHSEKPIVQPQVLKETGDKPATQPNSQSSDSHDIQQQPSQTSVSQDVQQQPAIQPPKAQNLQQIKNQLKHVEHKKPAGGVNNDVPKPNPFGVKLRSVRPVEHNKPAGVMNDDVIKPQSPENPSSTPVEKEAIFLRDEVLKLFPKDATGKRVIKSTEEGLKKSTDFRKNLNDEELYAEIAQNKEIISQIEQVCDIACILKQEVGPSLSEKKRVFHLGSKFSGLPASFELLRKKDGTIETLVKLKFLGKGTSKKVTLAWIYETGKSIVRGKTKLEHPKLEESMKLLNQKVAENEEKILTLLKDVPHVLHVDDIAEMESDGKRHQIIYMEKARCDLFDYMKNQSITSQRKKELALAILEGMIEVHKRNVIHRDMKPENILMVFNPKKPEELQPKISDFGNAIHAPKGSDAWNAMQNECYGSDEYISPEMWQSVIEADNPNRRLITSQSDDWAVGCVLWRLFTGKRPPWGEIINFDDPTTFVPTLLALVKEDNLPRQGAGTLAEIAWKMLRPNLEDRMTCQQALEALEKIKA